MTEVPPTVDLITLARFAVLPGAVDLLEAFASIPPGALRDSVIHHAKVIASTYVNGAGQVQMPDPLLMAASGGSAPRPSAHDRAARPALPAPAVRTGPIAESPEGRVVAMGLEGQRPTVIARTLELPLREVREALRQAKAAGVVFPRMGAPKLKKPGARYITNLDDVREAGMPGVERAAAERGISPEAYMDRRAKALQMGEAGAGVHATSAATGETHKIISGWFSQARVAGHTIPYETPILTAQIEEIAPEVAPPPPPPPKVRKYTFPLSIGQYTSPAQLRVARTAAAERGVTLGKMMQLRRAALKLFRAGKTTGEVHAALHLRNAHQARNWRNAMKGAGLLDPPFSPPPQET